MRKKMLITFCFLLLTVAGFAQNSGEVEVLRAKVYQKQVSSAPQQFVDVRTPQEYKEGHIKGAENIDFLKENFLSKMDKFDRNEPLYIYCRSGNRSSKAAAQLTDMGFKQIIDLDGGYKAWEKIEEEN